MPSQDPHPAPAASTVLYQDRVTAVPNAYAAGDNLWLTLPELTRATGWEVTPEGLCRDVLCVPLPEDQPSRFLHEERGEAWFNLTEFARLVEQPFAQDAAHRVWSFGPPSWEWKGRLTSPLAPDFTLPDLEGKPHSLSDLLGKKVFLACWASY